MPAPKFSLVKATDEWMTRSRVGFPHQFHHRPSEASVMWVDGDGDRHVAGGCARAVYFRAMGVERPESTTPYTEWIFACGKGVEEILVEQWKQMGIWVANNVEFYWPEYNIKGELDVILHEPGSDTNFIVECCSPETLIANKDYLFSRFDDLESKELIDHKGGIATVKNIQIKTVDNETLYRPRGKFDGLLGEFTNEHPILTANIRTRRLTKDKKKRTRTFQGTSWTKAGDLKRGQYVCIPKAKFGHTKSQTLGMDSHYSDYEFLTEGTDWQHCILYGQVQCFTAKGATQFHPIPSKINDLKKFYWLLGLYLAEGSCSKGSVYFSLHEDEIDIIERIRQYTKDLWDLDIAVRSLGDTKGINVSISSVAIRTLFSSIIPGNTINRTKHIRYERISEDPELLKFILQGAYEGDGAKASGEQYRISTAVHNLAYFYFQVASRCGLHPRIKKNRQMSQFNSESIYVVEWGSLKSGNDGGNTELLIDCGDFWAYKIKKIDTRSYSGEVYNLEAEPENTYMVGAIATHNCKSFAGYNATKDIIGNKHQDGAPKTSQMLQAVVYLYFFRKQFPYVKMVYYARDSADRTEYDLTLVEEGPGKTRVAVNGVIDSRFYVENILQRYRQLDQYIQKKEVPPRDYELAYSAEKIEKMWKQNKVAKTTYEAWKKGRAAPGDWQCRYCNWRKLCHIDKDD